MSSMNVQHSNGASRFNVPRTTFQSTDLMNSATFYPQAQAQSQMYAMTMPTTSNGSMFDAPRYPTESFYQKNGQGQNFRKSLPLSSKGSRTYRPTSDSNFRKNPNNIPLKQTSNTIISNEREDISTERSQEKSDTGTQNEEILSETNLYIRGLPADTTDQSLRELCEEYGKVTSTKAIIDKGTNQCKGYGFVDFNTPEAAKMAVKSLNEKNKNIQVQMAKQQEQDPTNLYIANLPSFYDEEKLENLLNTEGDVISTRILRYGNSSRGVGFARMHSRECCNKIIRCFNGRPLDENNPNELLIVKLADSNRKMKRFYPSSLSSGIYPDHFTRTETQQQLYPFPLSDNRFAYFSPMPYYSPDITLLSNQMQQNSLSDSVGIDQQIQQQSQQQQQQQQSLTSNSLSNSYVPEEQQNQIQAQHFSFSQPAVNPYSFMPVAHVSQSFSPYLYSMSKPLDNQQYVGINQNQQTQPTQVPLMSNYGQSFISTIDQASMSGQQQLLQMPYVVVNKQPQVTSAGTGGYSNLAPSSGMFYSTPLFYPPSQSLTFHQNTLPQYTTLIRPDEPSSVEAPSSTQQPSQISYAAKVAGSDSYKQERSESRGYKNYTKSHASPLHALSKPNQEHHPSGTPNDPEPGSEL